MTRPRPYLQRSIGALIVLAMVSFHGVSAWAAACGDCEMIDMGCCPAESDQAPVSDELNQASCCDVPPLEALRALSELTPATLDTDASDSLIVAPNPVATDVQAPLIRVEQPRVATCAIAPPPTRTTVLLL